MQISPAMRIASSAISRADNFVLATSARAAASAYEPPEPIASTPSSGEMTSPFQRAKRNSSRQRLPKALRDDAEPCLSAIPYSTRSPPAQDFRDTAQAFLQIASAMKTRRQ